MPANPFTVLPAPTGYDNTNDPLSVPNTTAQALVNFICDRAGLIRGMGQLIPVADLSSVPSVTFSDQLVPTRAYNLAEYQGSQVVDYPGVDAIVSNPAGNRIIVEIAGELYACAYVGIGTDPTVMFYPPYPALLTPPVMIPSSAANEQIAPVNGVYPKMRYAQFGKELLLVRGWVQYTNQRYYVAVNSVDPSPDPGILNNLGLNTPSPLVIGSTINYNSPSGGDVAKVGLIQYTYTLADEFMRQSSPPIAVTMDFNANPTKDAKFDLVVTNPTSGPLYWSYYFLYATVQGGSLFYQIATGSLTFGTNTITYEDGQPDAVVETGTVGPRYGENDPPLPADQIAVFKNRCFLNSLLNPNEVQVSNEGSPTQFNSQGYLPTLGNVNDGVTLEVDSDYGDPEYQMIVFGSYLTFFKRNGIYLLYGQDASSFQIQPLQSFRGAASPNTAARCENVLVYLSNDGVYQFDGVNCIKLSKPIEKSLLAYQYTNAGQQAYAKAQAVYVNRRYILNIGTDIYIFDLDAAANGQSGWTTMLFGVDVASWMQLNYGYDIFTGILTAAQPTSNQAIAGSGIPMPAFVRPPLPPPSYPLPPTTSPPPVFLPPSLTSYAPGGGIDSNINVFGTGLLTVSLFTINGVNQQYMPINDTEINYTVHSGTSGLMVLENPYGITTVSPFVVAGFVDQFIRANSALPGSYGWGLQQGTNTMNIVSDQLVLGVPANSACFVTNSGEIYADGWVVGQFIFSATGTIAGLGYRSSGGSSWNGYYALFEWVSGSNVFGVSLYVVTGGSASQVGSTINYDVTGFVDTQFVPCSVHFVAGAHTFYIGGAAVHQFTDSTYESAGEAGPYYAGACGTPICVGIAVGA